MRALPDGLDKASESTARPSTQIDEHLQVELVHFADDGRPLRRGQLPVMAVNIDDRKLGARDRMLVDDQGRARRVFLDRQRWLVGSARSAPLRVERRCQKGTGCEQGEEATDQGGGSDDHEYQDDPFRHRLSISALL